MPVLKSKHLLWLLLLPITFIIYLPLIGLGLYNYKIMLDPNPFYNLLLNLYHPLLIFNLYSLWVVSFHWRDEMNNLFYRTVVFIVIGLFLWTILGFQTAF